MKVYKGLKSLVGNTPLYALDKIKEKFNLKADIYAKIESQNPTGSIKDRPALYMILDAEEKGLIKKGGVIIEPTSGNTGIGLACFGTAMGYNVKLVMPSSMSKERISFIKAYGAEVILTDASLGMKGSIDYAEKLHKETPNSIIAGQFYNKANPYSHYMTTGREIFNDTDGKVDIFVAGIGSSGTLTGTAKYLKEVKKSVITVGVEPESSPLITKGQAGGHKIQGIGANFIPDNFDRSVVDSVMTVSNENAIEFTKLLARVEGLFSGISSGANVCAVVELAKKPENKGKVIVTVLPDSGDRYLSSGIFDE